MTYQQALAKLSTAIKLEKPKDWYRKFEKRKF